MVVYDDDGAALGVVDGFTGVGFEVDTDADVSESLDASDLDVEGATVEDADVGERVDDEQEHIPGQEFGEGYINWRCTDCGQVGSLDDGLPIECPNCGSEEVIQKRED